MIAPELPADTHAAASPCLHRRAHTLIDESVFDRTACAGWSSISMTWLAGTKRRLGCASSRRWTRSGTPTTATSTPSSRAAWAAPITTCSGAWSPPMPSTAMRSPEAGCVRTGSLARSLERHRGRTKELPCRGRRPNDSLLHVALLRASSCSSWLRAPTCSDVECGGLGVRRDELLARLDVAAHQLLEDVVDRGRVLDVDTEQGPPRRIHGGLPQLVRVHLAETLEAAHLDLPAHPLHLAVALGVAVDPARVLSPGQLVQRRLGHEHVAVLDQRREVSVEEGQQQRPDVGAVDVCVGHRDDL